MKHKKSIQSVSFVLCLALIVWLFSSCSGHKRVTSETKEITTGIDVAVYQGTIDWAKVSQAGVDFAMIRVGFRTLSDGVIQSDSNALYNLQEAGKYGISVGVYFFSTAVSEEEAVEEANWVIDFISQYPVTYPVAYDCERYLESSSRQYGMTAEERTDAALAFLSKVEEAGYEGMFYGSKNVLETQWELSRIEKDYKIWVAQYPEFPYPTTLRSSYTGNHHMWQYTQSGTIPGISQNVDLNVAYFGFDGIEPAQNSEPPEEAFPDVEALMHFTDTNLQVTAKIETNLRSIPSQDDTSQVLYTLQNGETAQCVALSDSGWAKLIFQGKTYYALADYLITLGGDSLIPGDDPAGIQTQFEAMDDYVTAKDEVNLRTMPSVDHPDCQVIVCLQNGQVVHRTGINRDVGWSRVVYEGQTLYCISSYLTETSAP